MHRHLQLFALLMATLWLVDGGLRGEIHAAPPAAAYVTQLTNIVRLVSPGASRSAVLRECVGDGTVIQTGANSRAELTFADQTVVRLAANTAFSFNNGSRDLNLSRGAVLVESSKNGRGAKIHAGKITANIAGTTAMLEYYPGMCKFVVLTGNSRLYRPGHIGDSVLIGPGQMVIGNPNDPVSDPVDFDIGRFVKTSRFLVNLPPLPSAPLIASEARHQQREISSKTLIETNMVIHGGGTLVSLVSPPNQSPATTKKHEKN